MLKTYNNKTKQKKTNKQNYERILGQQNYAIFRQFLDGRCFAEFRFVFREQKRAKITAKRCNVAIDEWRNGERERERERVEHE